MHLRDFNSIIRLCFFISLLLLSVPSFAANYYVDPIKGDDHNIGSFVHPFKTIKKAISILVSGDTVYLRGGRYHETNIRISCKGSPNSWITIRNYPGEIPIIDGSIECFKSKANNNWILVDNKKMIYKSRYVFSGLAKIEGYFKEGDQFYKLVGYNNRGNLFSDNYNYSLNNFVYVGPGIFWDSHDARIYIRLQKANSEAIHFQANAPSVTDPRKSEIYICGPSYGFLIADAAYIKIEGIKIVLCRTSLRIDRGHHLVFKNISSQPGKYSIVMNKNITHVTIESSTFNNYHPNWVAWCDVKSGIKPAYGFQDSALEIRKGCKNIKVVCCKFKNIFDGIDIIEEASDIKIHNNRFENIKDDCIQLGSATYNIEIDHNMMIGVFTGISRHGSGENPRPGTKYIHHNIIDCRKRILAGRKDPKGQLDYDMFWFDSLPWVYHNPIAYHRFKLIGIDPWKIYNNTFLFGRCRNHYGAGHTNISTKFNKSFVHEVYNNIFYQIHDGEIGRGATIDNYCEIYDGNIYYKESATNNVPIFLDYKFKGKKYSFKNLDDFLRSKAFTYTKKYYAPGWDAASDFTDPMLDDEYVPDPISPARSGGVVLPDGWPGAGELPYRGAISPCTINPPSSVHKKLSKAAGSDSSLRKIKLH